MAVIFIFLTFCGSIVLTLQKVVNAALGKRIGSMESSFVNHIVGTLFAGLLLAIGLKSGQIHFENIPPYLFLGGFFGVFMIFFVNYAIPIIGVMATLICLILAQLITSSTIDHYGFINANILKIGYLHIAGIALIICGALLVLIRKK